jgi:hypothetical protein
MDDDDIILMAGLGAFLVAYSGARGAAEVADQVFDVVTDPTGTITDVMAKNPILRALGAGRKGGIL